MSLSRGHKAQACGTRLLASLTRLMRARTEPANASEGTRAARVMTLGMARRHGLLSHEECEARDAHPWSACTTRLHDVRPITTVSEIARKSTGATQQRGNEALVHYALAGDCKVPAGVSQRGRDAKLDA